MMLDDWLGTRKIHDVAESRFKTQQLPIDCKAPAINTVQSTDLIAYGLDIHGFFVQGDTQVLSAAESIEVIADTFRRAEQPVRERWNKYGVVVVKSKQSFKIAAIDGLHPILD